MSLFTRYRKIPTIELIVWLRLIEVEDVVNLREGYHLNYEANRRVAAKIERELKRRHIDKEGHPVD